jgi:two-component system sensor histidine kinase HydH
MAAWQGLRRELRRAGGDLETAFGALMEESGELSITYAATLDRSGQVMDSLGSPKTAKSARTLASRLTPGRFRRVAPVIEVDASGIARALFPIPRRLGRWAPDQRGGRPALVRIELVTVAGPRIVKAALNALYLELGAAVVLLVVTLLLWRQSVVAERQARTGEAERREMAVQLEKDKGLKTLGRMSAVLGHELKNPIAALKGHAQLLLERLGDGHPAEQQARAVVLQAEKLETLTAEVLAFIKTGELNPTKVYLDDLAHTAVALSGVDDVRVSVPEEVTWQLDRPRMEQALINLLVNARQASPKGEAVDLTVAVREARLTIAVRDRGEGVRDEEAEKIFTPFFTGRAQGTGLGLALVKRIVESHGGTVSVTNRGEGGAVFEVVLPERAPASTTRGDEDG